MQTGVSVSVVFTDLVGSTELASRLGAAQCLLGRLTSDPPLVEEALAIARAHGYRGTEAQATDVLASLRSDG